jgi:phage terminase large subunit-like protein
MRSGKQPQIVVSSTPKPTPVYREIRKHKGTIITRFSSFANRENLAEVFFSQVIAPLMGSRLGRQEIEAEMLEDVAGALWNVKLIDRHRLIDTPHLDYIAIGVDPPAADTEADVKRARESSSRRSDGNESAECGIVAAGSRNPGDPKDRKHAYVLNDYSVYGPPEVWGEAVVQAYHNELADVVIAEANNGGAMVRTVIHSIDRDVPVELVWASRGKRSRAEPISVESERGRVHHVGYHALLESQLCTWIPGERSPDRMDAYVWVLTKLLLGIRRGAGQLARESRNRERD